SAESSDTASIHKNAPAATAPTRERPAIDHAFVEPAGARGGAASGRVIDQSTGTGVANAELTFTSDAGAIALRTTGAGEVELVATPGTYGLESVTAAGFVPYAPGYMVPTMQLELARDRAVRDLAVFLAPDVAIRGRVVDESGQPAAGAAVALVSVPHAGAETAW